jgi:hypothetical protein
VPAGALVTSVLFGFAALSCVLGVVLPWRGSERARTWVLAQETFIAFLGLAVFGTSVLALDAFIVPIGLFIVAGIFMAACAVADLLFGSARDYRHERAAL